MSAEKGQPAAPGADPEPLEGLSGKQSLAVQALAQGQTTAQAAAAAGVNERTARRWRRIPHFCATLLELRREFMSQAVCLAQRYSPVAVATLGKVMTEAAAPASSRVAASATILKVGRSGIE